MADSDTEVIAWHMGAPVVHESSIADIMNALAFGRDDSSSWLSIRDKLISRGCKTVGSLEEGWSHEELISLIRPAVAFTRDDTIIPIRVTCVCSYMYRNVNQSLLWPKGRIHARRYHHTNTCHVCSYMYRNVNQSLLWPKVCIQQDMDLWSLRNHLEEVCRRLVCRLLRRIKNSTLQFLDFLLGPNLTARTPRSVELLGPVQTGSGRFGRSSR